MKQFSYKERNEILEQVDGYDYDLIILGGGITGAGAARDAAMRGMKVLLIEASDFASGTSSRSSKLIHGGIRYLENYEFRLVFEALNERTKLFAMAPHMVHPLRFMLPVYEDSRVSKFTLGLGMWLYDALSLFQSPEIHENLNQQETVQRMPDIQQKGLKGSFIYSDAYMDDDRLVLETLRSANEHGAHCVNYMRAIRILKDQYGNAAGIEMEDQITKQKHVAHAHKIISTLGPWTDLFAQANIVPWKKILRPTKGIHLTFHKSRLPLQTAVVMAVEKGNRIVFGIPRHEMIIVGTTDTDYDKDPSDVKVLREDVDYLLGVVNQYFPGSKLTRADIVSSYSGVRPLVHDGSDNEGKTSREHTIFTHESGVVFVAGGKYTTYRLMAQQVVDEALKSTGVNIKVKFREADTTEPLNPYCTPDNYSIAVAQSYLWKSLILSNKEKQMLASRYGFEAEVLIDERPTLDYWELEAYYALTRTMCVDLTDFFVRRVPLFLADSLHGVGILNKVANIFADELGWSDAEAQMQMDKYSSYIKQSKSWQH